MVQWISLGVKGFPWEVITRPDSMLLYLQRLRTVWVLTLYWYNLML